jgi:PHD/YefM family antitoxin component YafN of YafNO toxin-antitoxin module
MSDICAGKACIITKDGRARAVLLDIDRYNAMVDALEAVDEQDLDSSRDLAKLCLAWRRELLR